MPVTASERYLNGKPRSFSSLIKSYVEELRNWATGRATGYGIAMALMLIGVLSIFAAIAVGAMALFHFLELRYGTYIACAALGGGILLLAVVFLLAGYQMLRRPSPVPKPERQLQAARQMLLGTTIARGITSLRATEAAKPDTITQLMLGTAALVVIGWLAAHKFGSTSPKSRLRQ
jgi:hypothetical protein